LRGALEGETALEAMEIALEIFAEAGRDLHRAFADGEDDGAAAGHGSVKGLVWPGAEAGQIARTNIEIFFKGYQGRVLRCQPFMTRRMMVGGAVFDGVRDHARNRAMVKGAHAPAARFLIGMWILRFQGMPRFNSIALIR